MRHQPYIPQNLGEIMDQLAFMMLTSPTFKDKTGYFPRQNIDSAFTGLNGGLLVVRKEIGEERYAALRTMSDRMRTLFDSDPDDTTGGAQAGRKLIGAMEDILAEIAKRAAKK